MSRNTLEVELIRKEDNKIDQDATLYNIVEAVKEMAALEKSDYDAIVPAVSKVWADNPKERSLTLDTLASFATRNVIGEDALRYQVVRGRVIDYIRGATNLYIVNKRLGVLNLVRLSEKDRKKAIKAQEAAEKKAAEKKSQS